jgi:4-hydroxy-tetrahydrodipicolinate synthase
MNIIDNKPDGFYVISGDDALTFPMITLGAEGVISVVANSFPFEFSRMVNLARIGDVDDARDLHYLLYRVIKLLFSEGSPAGIKAALEIQGIISNNLRLPMMPVTNELYQDLAKEITNIKDK